MHYLFKLSLLLLSLAAIHTTIQLQSISPSPSLSADEKHANFNSTELQQLRQMIHKAGAKHNDSFSSISLFIYGQMNTTFPGFWNIAVYLKQDFDVKFHLTGMYDESRPNKRYYQVNEPNSLNFSVLILETNNTFSTHEERSDESYTRKDAIQGNDRSQGIEGRSLTLEGLQFEKNISKYVTPGQEAGIDLAMRAAYLWNRNIINFSTVVQINTELNLNQFWQVCTRIEHMNDISFHHTSVYDEWVEYIGYGTGSYVWHVYLYRNYANG